MKFSIGLLVLSPGAMHSLIESGQQPEDLIERHKQGDWGCAGMESVDANAISLEIGGPLFSCYQLDNGHLIWVVTGKARRLTTILLPSEYGFWANRDFPSEVFSRREA